jgi:hypothetical protein
VPRGDLIELRAGPAAQWATVNPVLADGEPGAAIDGTMVVFKVGNGVTAWDALPIANAVTLSEFLGQVADEPAMLALVGNRGDWAIRSDLSATFIITAEPSSALGNWQRLPHPLDAVLSVNGRTGAVVGLAEASDVTALRAAMAPIQVVKSDGNWPVGVVANTWAEFDTTGSAAARSYDIVIPGVTAGQWIVAGAKVNPVGDSLVGTFAWALTNNAVTALQGTIPYQIQAGDIENGAARFRLYNRNTTTTARSLVASGGGKVKLWGSGPF